jgi:hypothetical protein
VAWNGKGWYFLWSKGIFGGKFAFLMDIWECFGFLVYFPRFGILCQEKSGKPVMEAARPGH